MVFIHPIIRDEPPIAPKLSRTSRLVIKGFTLSLRPVVVLRAFRPPEAVGTRNVVSTAEAKLRPVRLRGYMSPTHGLPEVAASALLLCGGAVTFYPVVRAGKGLCNRAYSLWGQRHEVVERPDTVMVITFSTVVDADVGPHG